MVDGLKVGDGDAARQKDCVASGAFIDPCKTRMVTLEVRLVSPADSVTCIQGLKGKNICPLPQKARRSGRLRSTRCIASLAPRWWILADGTCRSSIPQAAGW